MDQAGLPERLEGELAERTGTIIGSGLGGSGTLVEQITINATRGPDRLSPFFIPMAIANLASGQTAISFGAKGPNWATVSACATAGHAIGEATETIIRGDADIMVAGGSEAPIFEPLVGAFAAMRALSTRNDDPTGASRPFDEGRDGFVIAEGAGVLVLEELGHARRRGVQILAELCGYGATADAHHITLPAPGGAGGVRAARMALAKAGHAARGHRPRQRPCHVHAGGRPGRARGVQDDLRRARAEGVDHGDQGRHRPHARRGRRHRRGRDDLRDARRLRAADAQPRRPVAGDGRSRLHAADGAVARHARRAGQRLRLRRPELRARLPSLGRGRDATSAPAPTPQGLVELIDRLERLLDESELSEIEVEAGTTGFVLRKPNAFAAAAGRRRGRRGASGTPAAARQRSPPQARRLRLSRSPSTRSWPR